MKIYLVGGAVRDQLLGLPVKERDWVVVGAGIDDMLRLGYQQVGKEFPVFLHPKTFEEYALARMERKVKPGYKGFTFDTSPEVSLEEDLLRRDLTINAMALDPETGEVIDPYGGQADLAEKVLRHVSPAFEEDPVRILRVGRFLARFGALGFTVAPSTFSLMKTMVNKGEVNALVAERVWKEWERTLSESHPELFFEVLSACGALPILFPELIAVILNQQSAGWLAFMQAIKLTNDNTVRLAVLFHDLPEAKNKIATLFNRYRLPNAYRELSNLVAQFYALALMSKNLPAKEVITLFSGLDIYRRGERFLQFLLAVDAIAHARNLPFDKDWLFAAAQQVKSVDVQALVAQNLEGPAFAAALREKRIEKMTEFLTH